MCIFVFLTKKNLKTGWLDLSVGGRSNLGWSLILVVSHSLSPCDIKWCSCEHFNCQKSVVAGCQLSISWCPLSIYPAHADPVDFTQIKNPAKFLPQTRFINRKKNRSEKQTERVRTDQPCPAPNSRIMRRKRCCSAWIITPNQSVTCLLNLPPSSFCPITKIERLKTVKLVGFLF